MSQHVDTNEWAFWAYWETISPETRLHEWIPDTPPWHVHNLGILLLPPSRPRVCQMHFSEWEFYILRSIHSTWEHTRAPRVRTGCEGRLTRRRCLLARCHHPIYGSRVPMMTRPASARRVVGPLCYRARYASCIRREGLTLRPFGQSC